MLVIAAACNKVSNCISKAKRKLAFRSIIIIMAVHTPEFVFTVPFTLLYDSVHTSEFVFTVHIFTLPQAATRAMPSFAHHTNITRISQSGHL